MTLFDILNWAMIKAESGENSLFGSDSVIAQTVKGNKSYDAELEKDFLGMYFFVYDNYGKLTLSEISVKSALTFGEELPILGDESLLTDYRYELSIDKNTWNQVFVLQESKDKTDKENKKLVKLATATDDKKNIKKWGILNKTVTVKDGATEQQIEEYKNLVLEQGNKVSKTMKLNAIGFPIFAGDSYILDLKKLGIYCK